MPQLRSLLPDRSRLLSLQSAELAGYVLEVLAAEGSASSSWHKRNFLVQVARAYAEAAQPPDYEVGLACSSAWSWLEANGFICQNPENDLGWYALTQRGRLVRDHQRLASHVASEQLPESFVHPELLINCRPLFLQGRFETAVFEAFKSLEVAIREASSMGHEMIGVSLASKAFHPEEGPPTDRASEKGERVALMNLVTGAIGSYKNPSSHRRVAISSSEAREMIILASHLLRIVRQRGAVDA
jgi:uncharacterized protein (TIGR02391 family)